MQNRLLFLLSSFYFFFFAIIGVYIIYMPKVLELYGYSSLQIGTVFAMSPLMRFVTPFFFLKKLHLSQNIYLFALFLAFISALLFYITIDKFFLFLIPNILLGIAFALILPYAETIALEKIGKEHYGRARLWGSIGFIVVALVLAKFMDTPTYALHFLFITILCTILFGLPLIKYEKNQQEITTNTSFSLFVHWRFWVSLFLMQVSFGAFYNFFTIYENEHGLGYDTISYLWTFGVICEIVMLYFQAPLMRKNLLSLIKFSTASAVVRWALLYLFPTNLFILYLAQSLHTFSFALYYSAAISYLFEVYANKRLAQQFFGGISFGLGGFVGSIVAGYFYGEYLFLYASIVALLAYLFIAAQK